MSTNQFTLLFFLFFSAIFAQAQESDQLQTIESPNENKKKLIDTLTYQTQSGLPIAASKIYFTDAKFTFSGYGESNYINYLGPKNRGSNDLELYYTNLQRFVTYAAWKPKKWLVLYGEFFAEFLNDGRGETHFEVLPELFVDFLIHDKFNLRVGSHQPGIGYINNSDEPIMFSTVNRPEVERVIIPSQWIDFGIMTYGNITKDLKWTFAAYQGLDAHQLNGATWMRRGRDETLRFNFNSYLLNSKLVYKGIKDTELSVSGVFTQLGGPQENSGNDNNKANTLLTSAYARHTHKNWSFMALGAYGTMKNTEMLYELTRHGGNGPQVLGEQVYGFYTEVSYDIWHLLGLTGSDKKGINNFFMNSSEFKLPVFARFERLNTHARVSEQLANEAISQSDLTTLTFGFNFNPRRNIVLKSNYQVRWNKAPLPTGELEGNRFEMGVGFIF